MILQNVKERWINIPILQGKLPSEIEHGFETISEKIQVANYVPLFCKKEILSDFIATYKVESDVYESESNRYVGMCIITIRKEYKEETKENVYTLLDYEEKNIGE